MSDFMTDSSGEQTDINDLWTSPCSSAPQPRTPPLSPTPVVVPSYIREMIHVIDSDGAFAGVDLNDERGVRNRMKVLAHERLAEKVVRLKRLKSTLSKEFPDEVHVIERNIRQCLTEIGEEDMLRLEQKVRVVQRTDALDRAIDSKTLIQDEDTEIFKVLIQSQAKMIKQIQ